MIASIFFIYGLPSSEGAIYLRPGTSATDHWPWGYCPSVRCALSEPFFAARRKRLLILELALALLSIGCAVAAVWLTRTAWRERVVWQTGMEGRLLSSSGQLHTTSKFGVTVFYDYRLDVAFADAAGARHAAHVEFETLWTPVDQRWPLSLRYLPADPSRPALSWAIDAGGWRWGMPIMIWVMLAVFVLAGLESYRRQIGREGALREVALDGEEVLLPLLSMSRHRQTWTVRYERTPGASVNAFEAAPPLIALRDGKQYLVALRSARGGDPVLLPEDLRVFEMSASDRAATLVRAATR